MYMMYNGSMVQCCKEAHLYPSTTQQMGPGLFIHGTKSAALHIESNIVWTFNLPAIGHAPDHNHNRHARHLNPTTICAYPKMLVMGST